MTVFQYHKKALQEMKGKPKAEQWSYFLEYYKWYAVAAVVAIIILVNIIVLIATNKSTILGGMLIDGYSPEDEYAEQSYLASLSEYLEVNPKKEEIRIDTGISLMYNPEISKIDTFQKIQAGLLTKTTDFITAQTYAFNICVYNTSPMFADLRDHLDMDTLTQLEGKLFYMDRSIIEQMRQAQEQGQVLDAIEYPDPTAPDTMSDPIPVGINIVDCSSEFLDIYYGVYEDTWLGITTSSQHPEKVMKFIDHLFNGHP